MLEIVVHELILEDLEALVKLEQISGRSCRVSAGRLDWIRSKYLNILMNPQSDFEAVCTHSAQRLPRYSFHSWHLPRAA